MPKNTFKLSPDDPRPLVVQWKGFWKNIQVTFDGQLLGTIADSKALKAGQSFALPDGATLEVKLKTGMQPGLVLSRNGVPLAGSAGDPEAQLKLARGIVWFIGGATLTLGILAEVARVDILLGLGMSWLTAGAGVIFLVLGYFVGKRSRLALAAAIALLITDTLATLYVSAEAGGNVATGGIVMRAFFLIAMFQGFKAIKDLEAAAQVKASAEVF